VDLQPIFAALGVKSEGSAMFWNKVCGGGMGWTSELSKFGAQAFQSDPHRIITFGDKTLAPAELERPHTVRVTITLPMLVDLLGAKPVRCALAG
jgi:UDP-N-acetylglucosamine 1-carboxyvinyltransferase